MPNIFIGGTHIGGFTDLSAKIKNGVAINLLDQHGIHYNLWKFVWNEYDTNINLEKEAQNLVICPWWIYA